MAKSKHVTAADLEELHKPGCLTRHQKRQNGNTCSHQWQAILKAQEHSDLYNVPEKPKWAVGYGTNFQHFKRPYEHNAHHIIPNGALKASIGAQGKKAAGLVNLIKQGLLKAEYNLNDKINMIILPQKKGSAQILGLPRHLKGDKNETRSHPKYSQEAEERLSPIMNEYAVKAAEAIDKAKGKHESPNADLTKKQLEDLSENLFNMIIIAGSDKSGASLSQVSDLIFSFG